MGQGLTLTGAHLSVILGIVSLLTVFAGLVIGWTKLKTQNAGLSEDIKDIKLAMAEAKKEQKATDDAQDRKIADVVTGNNDLKLSITRMNGKLDVVTTLLEERLPPKSS